MKLKLLMKILWFTLRLMFNILILGIEGLFFALHGLARTLSITGDALRLHRRLPDGRLRCPEGHVVPTEGEVYECQSCGFVYANGSVWVCANPECGVTTPYVNCPTCRLSVRNPYRWGRP